jgi:heme-degrading monooxygenase HmoA
LSLHGLGIKKEEAMFARITIATAKLDKLDGVAKIIRDSILPATKKQKGFNGFYDLVDRKTGKRMVISLWKTEADMLAGESSTFYKEQVAKAAPLLAGPTTMEHYEVSVKG